MTTGEFARIMRITKETLFHYDEIGLFQPELTQPNGYRYYSIYQTEILDTILLLKDLGMPLKEIKQQLANRDPAKMLHILEEREHQINTEIAKLRSMENGSRSKKARSISLCRSIRQPSLLLTSRNATISMQKHQPLQMLNCIGKPMT